MHGGFGECHLVEFWEDVPMMDREEVGNGGIGSRENEFEEHD